MTDTIWVVTDYEQDYYGIDIAAFTTKAAAERYLEPLDGFDFKIREIPAHVDPPTPWVSPNTWSMHGEWVSVNGRPPKWSETIGPGLKDIHIDGTPGHSPGPIEPRAGEWWVSVRGTDKALVEKVYRDIAAPIIAEGKALLARGITGFGKVAFTTESVVDFGSPTVFND